MLKDKPQSPCIKGNTHLTDTIKLKRASSIPKFDTILSDADRSTLASSKYSTINNYSAAGRFNFNVNQAFEEMIEDMNCNVFNKRQQELSANKNAIEQRRGMLSQLTEQISFAIEVKEESDRRLYELQQESNRLKTEYERMKAVSLHNTIEKLFLRKRNGSIQQEIEHLKQTQRQLAYERFGLVRDNEEETAEMKKKSIEIDALINTKKVLSTSIVLMNKKSIDMKKKIGLHMQKGETVFDTFNNIILHGK